MNSRLSPIKFRFSLGRRGLDILRNRPGKWWRNQDGTSAVEFALFAPVLFFALVAATDLGLAEHERMTIDHILRAGAQNAMADPGETEVLKLTRSTASKNFTLSDTNATDPSNLTLSVTRFCECPGSNAPVVCSVTCPGNKPTSIYYRLSGTKKHASLILPGITLNPSVRVQIR